MLKYKHIEASREIRMWLGQIIIPTVSVVMILYPEAREWTKTKIQNGINNIKTKFKKKESE